MLPPRGRGVAVGGHASYAGDPGVATPVGAVGRRPSSRRAGVTTTTSPSQATHHHARRRPRRMRRRSRVCCRACCTPSTLALTGVLRRRGGRGTCACSAGSCPGRRLRRRLHGGEDGRRPARWSSPTIRCLRDRRPRCRRVTGSSTPTQVAGGVRLEADGGVRQAEAAVDPAVAPRGRARIAATRPERDRPAAGRGGNGPLAERAVGRYPPGCEVSSRSMWPGQEQYGRRGRSRGGLGGRATGPPSAGHRRSTQVDTARCSGPALYIRARCALDCGVATDLVRAAHPCSDHESKRELRIEREEQGGDAWAKRLPCRSPSGCTGASTSGPSSSTRR